MKFLFIDDHKIFRDGVASLIINNKLCDEVLTCSCLDEARQYLEKEIIDLVILDLNLGNENGVELLSEMNILYPNIKKICLTMHDEREIINKVISYKVNGYITKSSGYDELAICINRVLNGDKYFDQAVLNMLVDNVSNDRKIIRRKVGDLTNREQEVFLMLSKDYSIEDISNRLFISIKTVENHRSNIYRKLNINDRLSLMRFAREQNIT